VIPLLFELPSFEYIDARNVREAVQSLRRGTGSASVFAGGTDLLGLMKNRVQGPELKVPELLVDIKTIAEIDRIDFDLDTGLTIGSAVTLSRLESSDPVRERYDILAQAARQIATTQIRNRGTVGGNLCQRPRCLYFRHPHFLCRKKGGERCFAAAGEHRHYHAILESGRCVAVHPSDLAPPFVALGSSAIVASAEGAKEIPLTDFFRPSSPLTETALRPGELLTSIRVPVPKEPSRQVFLKSRVRKASDFALASVAVVARVSEGVCEEIRIVLGGVAPFPYAASRSAQLLAGRKLDHSLILQAADASVEAARPLRNNAYKIDLTKALVLRALKSVSAEPTDR
jgi:xanthine dehydrogenase YagS FAD-binding subunit